VARRCGSIAPIDSTVRAGDHDIAVLRVLDAIIDPETAPIIFHASRLRALEI